MTGRNETSFDGAAGLAAAIARQFGSDETMVRKSAPVETWDPPFCGDIDMQIRRDGTWFYGGTPIGRARLVQLFSTVLRRDDDGETYLVTPVEKVRIWVEDAPFIAVSMRDENVEGHRILTARTNLGDEITIGAENPLRFEITGENAELKPYLLVRGRLEALFSRALTYDLMALGEPLDVDGTNMFVIRAGGEIFPVMAMLTLEKNF